MLVSVLPADSSGLDTVSVYPQVPSGLMRSSTCTARLRYCSAGNDGGSM